MGELLVSSICDSGESMDASMMGEAVSVLT